MNRLISLLININGLYRIMIAMKNTHFRLFIKNVFFDWKKGIVFLNRFPFAIPYKYYLHDRNFG